MALRPAERRTVELPLSGASLAYFDSSQDALVVEPETVIVEVGASSRDIRLERTASVGP